jgi:hypothetical protein
MSTFVASDQIALIAITPRAGGLARPTVRGSEHSGRAFRAGRPSDTSIARFSACTPLVCDRML